MNVFGKFIEKVKHKTVRGKRATWESDFREANHGYKPHLAGSTRRGISWSKSTARLRRGKSTALFAAATPEVADASPDDDHAWAGPDPR